LTRLDKKFVYIKLEATEIRLRTGVFNFSMLFSGNYTLILILSILRFKRKMLKIGENYSTETHTVCTDGTLCYTCGVP